MSTASATTPPTGDETRSGVETLLHIINLLEQKLTAQNSMRQQNRASHDEGIPTDPTTTLQDEVGQLLKMAADQRAQSMLELSLKLKLWRLHVLGPGHPEPLSPDEELIMSIHDDLVSLMDLDDIE